MVGKCKLFRSIKYKVFPIQSSQPSEVITIDSLFLVLLEVAFITLKVILPFRDLSTLHGIY